MTFSGPLADVNAALDGMRWDPDANYYGSAALTIATDDQGNTGPGGAKTGSDTLNITVDAVNDVPEASNDSYRVKEDKNLKVAPPGVLSNDTDHDGDDLATRLVSCPGKGKLTLSADGSHLQAKAQLSRHRLLHLQRQRRHGRQQRRQGEHQGKRRARLDLSKGSPRG